MAVDFLIRLSAEHGVFVVFLVVLVEQLGIPLPAYPILLLSGSLAARGDLAMPELLAAAVAASVLADSSCRNNGNLAPVVRRLRHTRGNPLGWRRAWVGRVLLRRRRRSAARPRAVRSIGRACRCRCDHPSHLAEVVAAAQCSAGGCK